MAASSSIRFIAEIEDVDGLFPPEIEISIYRIIQEALNNIVKHSKATQSRVLVTSNGETLDLAIEDNGCGFTPSDGRGAEQSGKGFGLLGIAERVRMLGGRVVIRVLPRPRLYNPNLVENANDDMNKIRIVIADDHPIFSQGLRQILLADTGIRTCCRGSGWRNSPTTHRAKAPGRRRARY